MTEPVFAVDEVRYRPDEPRERVFMGDSLESIELYRPHATNDPEATFTDLRQLHLPWYETFTRIAKASEYSQDWELQDYFRIVDMHSDNAIVLYIGDVDAPRLFNLL